MIKSKDFFRSSNQMLDVLTREPVELYPEDSPENILIFDLDPGDVSIVVESSADSGVATSQSMNIQDLYQKVRYSLPAAIVTKIEHVQEIISILRDVISRNSSSRQMSIIGLYDSPDELSEPIQYDGINVNYVYKPINVLQFTELIKTKSFESENEIVRFTSSPKEFQAQNLDIKKFGEKIRLTPSRSDNSLNAANPKPMIEDTDIQAFGTKFNSMQPAEIPKKTSSVINKQSAEDVSDRQNLEGLTAEKTPDDPNPILAGEDKPHPKTSIEAELPEKLAAQENPGNELAEILRSTEQVQDMVEPKPSITAPTQPEKLELNNQLANTDNVEPVVPIASQDDVDDVTEELETEIHIPDIIDKIVDNIKDGSGNLADQPAAAETQTSDGVEDAKSAYSGKPLFERMVELTESILIGLREEKRIEISEVIDIARQAVERVKSSSDLEVRALNRGKSYSLPKRIVNLAVFSLMIGQRMRVSQQDMELLASAALLHDLGMIRVPENILFKKSKLTQGEFNIVRRHPEYTVMIIEAAKDYDPLRHKILAQLASQVHEREDGSGYPSGLKADAIHPLAKILAVADVFEGICHPSHYRQSMVSHEALKEIVKQQGKVYSQSAIKALVTELSFFPVDSYVQLNNRQIGRVIGVNKTHPLRPVLEILFDETGRRLEPPVRMNLKEAPFLFIKKPLVPSDLPGAIG